MTLPEQRLAIEVLFEQSKALGGRRRHLRPSGAPLGRDEAKAALGVPWRWTMALRTEYGIWMCDVWKSVLQYGEIPLYRYLYYTYIYIYMCIYIYIHTYKSIYLYDYSLGIYLYT